MMDNDEVKIMRVKDKSMVGKKRNQKNAELFDGFLQRRSFFVIPQMDKLKKDKLELKQQMGSNHTTRQKYPKMRVKAAGGDLTKDKCLYYVTAI